VSTTSTTPPPATAPTGFDQLTAEQRQALLEVLVNHPMEALAQVPAGKALVLRSQAVEKYREASALLRQADEIEHAAVVAAQVADAERQLAAAEAQADGLAEAVPPRVAAERAAADRLADAEENLRLAVDAGEAAHLDEASPAELTDALVRVDAAKRVVDEFRAQVERAAADRLAAEAALAQGRDVVKRGREALKAVRTAAEGAAGNAPRSPYTLLLDWQWLLVTEADSLTKQDLDLVRATVLDLARQTGADRILINEARGQLREESQDRMRHALDTASPLPKRADVYVSVNAPARR
jgi:hypothetical protein